MVDYEKCNSTNQRKKNHIPAVLALTAATMLLISACSPGQVTTQTATTTIMETTTMEEETTAAETDMTTAIETTTQPSESMPGLDEPPEEIQLQPAFPNLVFDRPVQMQHLSSGSADDSGQGRFFVVEQGGRILTFSDPAVEQGEVFLDLGDKIDQSGQEMGLLGLAFHPRFVENGRFYVNYTRSGSAGMETVIESYLVDPVNPERALPDSGQEVISFTQPYSNHNGGHITFGLDGYLYIASGDGGSRGDPRNYAQRLDNLLGKILRIDVDRSDPGLSYAIPEDNPFLEDNEALSEIYAYGLRNPWRFSFSDLDDTLWAADVGQNRIEEINLITAGGNYGWNPMEGSLCYPDGEADLSCLDESFILPVHEYDHSQGRSITGGYVYAGMAVPSLQGAYIYGDFISGRIWALRYELDSVTGLVTDTANWLLLETSLRIAAFATDLQSEIYVLDYADGVIYIISPA